MPRLSTVGAWIPVLAWSAASKPRKARCVTVRASWMRRGPTRRGQRSDGQPGLEVADLVGPGGSAVAVLGAGDAAQVAALLGEDDGGEGAGLADGRGEAVVDHGGVAGQQAEVNHRIPAGDTQATRRLPGRRGDQRRAELPGRPGDEGGQPELVGPVAVHEVDADLKPRCAWPPPPRCRR